MLAAFLKYLSFFGMSTQAALLQLPGEGWEGEEAMRRGGGELCAFRCGDCDVGADKAQAQVAM